MKRTLVYSFITLILINAPTYAQSLAAQKDTKDAPVAEIKKVLPEPVLNKKQKIESDLRATIHKLQAVVVRTQKLIDLMNKNGKDISQAQNSLDEAKASIEEATRAIDQFAGIIPEAKDINKDPKDIENEKPKVEQQIIKEPIKKSQEFMKSAKASIVETIKILKDGLLPKESTED